VLYFSLIFTARNEHSRFDHNSGGRRERIVINVIFAFAALFQLQLSGGSFELPQIIEPEYSQASLTAGTPGVVQVDMDVRDGFKINRIPQMQLNLEAVDGLTLAETRLLSPSEDPKTTDTYYVDVPGFTVDVEAARAGSYEIPGELVYFFCNTADGYCSRQIVDVSIPVRVR